MSLGGRKARQRAWLEEANRLADARLRQFESDPDGSVRAVVERGQGWFEIGRSDGTTFHEMVVVSPSADVGDRDRTLVQIVVTWRPPMFSGSMPSAAKLFLATFEPRSVPWSAQRKTILPVRLAPA